MLPTISNKECIKKMGYSPEQAITSEEANERGAKTVLARTYWKVFPSGSQSLVTESYGTVMSDTGQEIADVYLPNSIWPVFRV